MNKIVYNEMKDNLKEWVIFGSGIFVLIGGLALVFIGIFAPPVGVIDATVLTAFGEALSFGGAAFGINGYVSIKIHEIDKHYEQKKKEEF